MIFKCEYKRGDGKTAEAHLFTDNAELFIFGEEAKNILLDKEYNVTIEKKEA